MLLTLTKSCNVTSAQPGDTIVFTIVITNTGTSSAQNIIITDIIPNCTNFVVGSLNVSVPFTGSNLSTGITLTNPIPSGGTCIITFNVLISNNVCECLKNLNLNAITNQATASYYFLSISSSGQIVVNHENANSNVITIPILCTSLQIKKESCKCMACLGEKIPYTIKVTNPGPATASNIIVSDSIPSGVYVTSFMAAVGNMSNNNNVITWTIPSLNPGASAIATIIAVATDSICFNNRGYFVNKSSIISYNGISNITSINDSVITYIDCFCCKCNKN
ncbi:MAG: DUF11 domain-containing protein [Terrisporobacter sp.]|uniref:DUF11 domain-containing protein n=1 Tax=Terrisporobacter sp. TaxID=1965305 RepID=UPI002FC5D3A9